MRTFGIRPSVVKGDIESKRAKPKATSPRVVLFSGHQVDSPGRPPRFPPDRDKEQSARDAIREALAEEIARYGGVVGIAGAASGGDILFHEVCLQLGIPTRLMLALPPDVYITESVAPGGDDWVRRFNVILERYPNPPVLADSKERPSWLPVDGEYSIWQRNNLWLLNAAVVAGGENVTLLALWNGEPDRGPGGTANMIEIAQARGVVTKILDSNVIFGLTSGT
jgi:hypothetical protein